jgi:chromosomal replication initiator protein
VFIARLYRQITRCGPKSASRLPGFKPEYRIENLTFARFVATPENCSALLAVREVAAALGSAINPLYVHGPAGSGKTHLMAALIEEAIRPSPRLIVTLLQAGDIHEMAGSWEDSREAADRLVAAKQSDLCIVEDLQHLSGNRQPAAKIASELVLEIFDHLHARRRQLVFTATVGPRHLEHLPGRLVSRLGSGLVVGIKPLQLASRLILLQQKAQRRQLAVRPEVLAWIAEHLSGGARQLDGALVQLETLARLHDCSLDVAIVADHFQHLIEAKQLTMEQIARRVGSYFRVDPRHLQSRRRYQNVLVPRQIGMYLARQLTDFSLEQIGSYFGGRDHSTVLHACRKIKAALMHNVSISGAVLHLQAELA